MGGFFWGGWEFGGKRVSGLRGQRVDLSMSECVSVFSRGGRGGGSLSNSKMRWNLGDSVGLSPLIIQSFKLLSQPHKIPEEEGKTKASVLTFSLFVQYRFHQVLPQLCTDEVKS